MYIGLTETGGFNIIPKKGNMPSVENQMNGKHLENYDYEGD